MPSAVTPLPLFAAAGLQAPGGRTAPSEAEGGSAFEALMGGAAATPRPAGAQIGRVASDGAKDGAKDGAATPDASDSDASNASGAAELDLAAALRAAQVDGAQAAPSDIDLAASLQGQRPEGGNIDVAKTDGAKAADSAISPKTAAAPADEIMLGQAGKAANAKADQAGAPKTEAAPPPPPPAVATDQDLAPPAGKDLGKADGAAVPVKPDAPGMANADGDAPAAPPPAPRAGAAEGAPGRADRAAAAGAEPGQAPSPKPSAAAAEIAREAAGLKRAGGENAVEPQVRSERGASDVAAARAPGELIRAAVREAGTDKAGARTEAGAKSDAAPPAAASAASKPTPSLPATPTGPVPAPTAMMMAASSLALDGALMAQAGGDDAGQGDLDLSVDQGLSRADARADVQRQALPSAANAHAAARFQPQTVHTLAARIAARAVEGGRVFDIRLDPAELGRVEVRLEMGADNSVRALLSAERADTLAELQRSARDLEKALADAGLDLADDGLSFSLSDEGQAFEDEPGAPAFDTAAWTASEALTAEAPAAPGPVRLYGFELAARSGLDVRI